MDLGIMLQIENLSVTIDGIDVVSDLSLTLQAGKTMALVGESGCGKSLTALAVMRLLPEVAAISRGSVRLKDMELTNLSVREMRQVRGNDLSMIFQEPGSTLDPLMPVGKQVVEAVRAHRPMPRHKALAEAQRMLAKVGIPDPATRMNQYPFELSGGMCQRIMIAVALICRPAVLIADEPTTALDVTIQAQTLALMRALQEETEAGILLITHDMGVVADMADAVMVMYAGKVVEYGNVFQLFEDPRHPYTRMLLASIPQLAGERKTRLKAIQGLVPDIRDWPVGCRFNPRCPAADEQCRKYAPRLESLEGGRQHVACWHHDLKTDLADAQW